MLPYYTLLSLLVVFWSTNIIFTKVALAFISPIYLTFFRLLIAALAMLLFLAWRRQLTLPSLKDLPLIFSIGLLQMGVFQILMTYGMSYVPAGRAAMLVYSTPLWATPIAILFFQEKLTPLKLLGLTLGLSGLFILFNPASFNWADPKVILGNGLLLLASFLWAGAMLHARFGKWHRSPLALAPWQLLISIIPPLLFLPVESYQAIQWNTGILSILLYNSVIATAFGMWANSTVTKELPVAVTSLTLLTVPAFSLLLSAMLLGEAITPWNFMATLFIMGGVGCIGMDRKPLKAASITKSI